MSGKQITLDTEALDALVEAKVAALLAQRAPASAAEKPPQEPTDADWQKGVDEVKGKAVLAQPYRMLKCKARTGATFIAHVVKSRKSPHGRIMTVTDYKYPAGVDKHEDDGGLVPNGFQIRKGSGPDAGELTPLYKQWRWNTFWQADLAMYNGAVLDPRDLADPADVDAPWLTHEVEEEKSAAAE